jgi:hypothetical protein
MWCGEQRRRGAGDRGSITPAFLALVWVTLIMGVIFFQVGRATELSAEAQTGGDAAALAAAEDLRNQILEWVQSGRYSYTPFIPNPGRATTAAQQYASDNRVVIRRISIVTAGYLTYDVEVSAYTQRTLTPQGSRSEDSETGETSEVLFGDGESAGREATARVKPAAGSFLADAGFWSPDGSGGFGPGAGGVATTSRGGCPISVPELRRLAAAAGVPEDFAVDRSALSRYEDCDGGQSVRPMPDEMKISLLRLEHAMPRPLQLNSGYRSPAYQAELCLTVKGPCAAPGASMHNFGLAVDVQNWQETIPVINADPSIGLCQPMPRTDAVHLSHVTGRECGGRTGGGANAPQAFGGYANLVRIAQIQVALVR